MTGKLPIYNDDGTPVGAGGEDTVYVITGVGGTRNLFHTDPDCPSVRQANNVVEKPRSVLFDDATECRHCIQRAGSSHTEAGP